MDPVLGLLEGEERPAPGIHRDRAEREHPQRALRDDARGVVDAALPDEDIERAAALVEVDREILRRLARSSGGSERQPGRASGAQLAADTGTARSRRRGRRCRARRMAAAQHAWRRGGRGSRFATPRARTAYASMARYSGAPSLGSERIGVVLAEGSRSAACPARSCDEAQIRAHVLDRGRSLRASVLAQGGQVLVGMASAPEPGAISTSTR